MQVEVRLYATLRKYAPAAAVAGVFQTILPDQSSVRELLSYIHIDDQEVHLFMVNGVGVTAEHILQDQDRVGLFPPVGGG